MIQAVTVINDQNKQLRLELANPWDSEIVVQSITGISAGKANINNLELATLDGSVFSTARLPSRNIVITLAFDLAVDVEEVRHKTYAYFPLKKEITLVFETDHRTTAVTGHVESNEADIFQQKETAQISIICDDPYFYADNADYYLNGVQPQFEFPFSNESLTDPLINFGELVYDTGTLLKYEGDVESGVIMHLHAIGNVVDFWIRNLYTGVRMEFDTGKLDQIVGDGNHDVVSSDDIYISTMPSNKYVLLYRNGVYYNCLSMLPKMTDWLVLQRGDNMFQYGATSGASNAQLTMQSYVIFSGV